MNAVHTSYSLAGQHTPKPSKTMPIIEASLSSMMAAAMAAAASLIMATIDPSPDHQLLFTCLAGGIGGGVAAVAMFPKSTVRLNAMKWLASSILTSLFAPAVCHFYHIDGDLIYSIAIAGAFGFSSWGVFYAVSPLIERAATGFANWFLRNKIPSDRDQ